MADTSIDREVVAVTYSGTPVEVTVPDLRAVVYMIGLATNSCAGLTTTTIGSHASKYFVCSDVNQLLLANINTPASFAAQTIVDVTAYFKQQPAPSPLRIIAVDTAGTDTYSDILTLYESLFPDFFALVPSSRTLSAIATLGTTLAAFSRKRIYIAQTNDVAGRSDTTTFNATALGTAYTGKTSCVLIGAEDAYGKALGYAGSLLGGDISVRCPPGMLPIQEVPPSSFDTTARVNYKANNINIHARLGKDAVLFPGKMLNGSSVEAFLTVVWAEADLTARMTNFAVRKAYSKTKTRMNKDGQDEVVAEHAKHIRAGIDADYFDGNAPWNVVALPVTDEDRTNEILRTAGYVKELRSARQIVSRTQGS